MEYKNLATQIYLRLSKEVQLSNYHKVVFHPDVFQSCLYKIHERMNQNYQNYSLKVHEIDWMNYVYPELKKYAQTVDPQKSSDRIEPIRTIEDGFHDLMDFLKPFFEHDMVGSRWKFENFLREQTGEYQYMASQRIGPLRPIPHPMMEQTKGGILQARDDFDESNMNYQLDENPYLNVLQKNTQAEQTHNDSLVLPAWY